jgi:hypothetical protein
VDAGCGLRLASDHLERAVVVAVVAVRMMQVTVDQVVDVVAVRHRLVAATWTVAMVRVMAGAAMVGRAAVGVPLAHGDDMLVDVVLVRMMQVAVMEIVDVAIMAHREMAAPGTVRMRMVGMDGMIV